MAKVNVKRIKSSEIEFKDRLVSIQRVTKVNKGGRTFSFSAIVVVGNENGIVGFGLGKAKEVTSAIAKGVDDAKKNLLEVPVINDTLPHAQTGKYSGAEVFIKPASPGTGVIAGGSMRAVLESVGVKNVLAKSKGPPAIRGHPGPGHRTRGPHPAQAAPSKPSGTAPGPLRPGVLLPGGQEPGPGAFRGPAAHSRELQREMRRLHLPSAGKFGVPEHPGPHQLPAHSGRNHPDHAHPRPFRGKAHLLLRPGLRGRAPDRSRDHPPSHRRLPQPGGTRHHQHQHQRQPSGDHGVPG